MKRKIIIRTKEQKEKKKKSEPHSWLNGKI